MDVDFIGKSSFLYEKKKKGKGEKEGPRGCIEAIDKSGCCHHMSMGLPVSYFPFPKHKSGPSRGPSAYSQPLHSDSHLFSLFLFNNIKKIKFISYYDNLYEAI